VDEYSDFSLERLRHPGDAALNIRLVGPQSVQTVQRNLAQRLEKPVPYFWSEPPFA
jgi:hypothetical protein